MRILQLHGKHHDDKCSLADYHAKITCERLVVTDYKLLVQFVTRDGNNGKEIAGVNWGFDAYGGMNDEHEKDDEIARCICKQADIDLIEGPMVLEAGSIHVDGEG